MPLIQFILKLIEILVKLLESINHNMKKLLLFLLLATPIITQAFPVDTTVFRYMPLNVGNVRQAGSSTGDNTDNRGFKDFTETKKMILIK